MFNYKAYMKVYRLANKEKTREYSNKYRLENPEKVKAVYGKWVSEHPEKRREINQKWRLTHYEHIKKYKENYHLAHPEARRKDIRHFFKTPKGKMAKQKGNANRKQFGFMLLNKYFKDSHGHHIDKQFVICIPTEMHEYNRHSVTQDRNMDTINDMAFNWLEAEELYTQFYGEAQ